jgi:hypothetical protein
MGDLKPMPVEPAPRGSELPLRFALGGKNGTEAGFKAWLSLAIMLTPNRELRV